MHTINPHYVLQRAFFQANVCTSGHERVDWFLSTSMILQTSGCNYTLRKIPLSVR